MTKPDAKPTEPSSAPAAPATPAPAAPASAHAPHASPHPFIYLVSSWRAVRNFAAMVALCTAVLVIGATVVAHVLRSNRIQLLQTSNGLLWHLEGNEVQVLTLAGSEPWANSGFKVRKGERVTIHANGRVHLALHRIVQGAQTKQRPGLPWVGPEGLPPDAIVDDPAKRAFHKKSCVLLKGQPLGALLVATAPAGTDLHALEPELVGRERDYEAPRDGYLFFSVNDTLFDDTPGSRACFESAPTNDALQMTFEQLTSQHYWHAWFDDNVGEFLITVRKE